MKKQILGALASATALGTSFLTASGAFAGVETPFCIDNGGTIEDVCYSTLQEAFDQAPTNGILTNIYLNSENTLVEDGGAVAKAGQNISLDFKGKTYKVNTLVGSQGTVSSAFQLLKGATVTMKNGEIASEVAKHYIQNYSNLTVEDIKIDASKNAVADYIVSSNCGSVKIVGDTTVIAPEGKAVLDVYYWPNGGYAEGVNLTINTTGTISGNIEYSGDGKDKAHIFEKAKINIEKGNFVGEIKVDDSALAEDEKANITISGGTFSTKPKAEYIVDGYYAHKYSNTKYVVEKITDIDPEEVAAIEEALGVSDLRISVSPVPLSETTKKLVDGLKIDDLQIAGAIEIKLSAVIEEGLPIEIHDTEGKMLTFTVEIPEEYRAKEGFSRLFYLVRIHETEKGATAETIPLNISKDGKTATFKSDKFSEFVLGYTETKLPTPEEKETSETPKAPDSGFMTEEKTTAISNLSIAVILSAIASAAVCAKKKLAKK